ncbi:hypothetical protein WJX72_006498 [[Myrmecia] bisecta]|uniref:Polyketide synthase n=1 Tax=[Myrmecia] bisecta TaxID=41462 RepID=A0AAW1Q5T4_9CHLO
MTQVHALSADGRCKAFGAEADGYGRGEGYTAVVLEELSAAGAEHTIALVAGSAVNQDGRSSGLTAPHGPSQQALITSAMAEAGTPFLHYASTHGTGTPLGDPIETGALRKARNVRQVIQILPQGHPLLSRAAQQDDHHMSFLLDLTHPAVAYLWHHRVQGFAIVASALVTASASTSDARPGMRTSSAGVSTFRDHIIVDSNGQVKAVGINFRDVLNVLGMYPGDPGPPGGDCSGTILRVGAGVSGLVPGDAVFGLAAGSLGTHVQASAQTMVLKPACLSFEQAATIPTVFTTVHSAFRQAANVQPGERVLIHAAAGGVGLAALQMTATLDACPIATAGAPPKRALLRSFGVRSVLASRKTCFTDSVMHLGGADMVLNSLTSSGMVAASAATLCLNGRLVEISKREIWSPQRIAQERPDVAYTLLAVDFMSEAALNSALKRVDAPKNWRHIVSLAPTSHQVLFSSVASLLGSVGQASYSAANAALDGLAASWQQQGSCAVSIQWGAWAGAGMAGQDAGTAARVARTGMALLPPAAGLAALSGILSAGSSGSLTSSTSALISVTPFKWDKFLDRFGSQPVPSLFGEFTSPSIQTGPSANATAATAVGKHAALSAMPPAARHAFLLAHVQLAVTNAIGSAVSPDESLMAAGLDSLGAVELKNSLEATMGMQLPGTLVFDFPTVTAIGDPGDVLTSSLQARDAIGTVPLDHWDVDHLGRSQLTARFGGFLADIEAFDAPFFNISGNEAELMDVQQRILLEASYEAVAQAGSSSGNSSSTCVAVGIASAEYSNYVVPRFTSAVSAYSATGGALSVASGRLAYTFAFKGPTLSVDTACSSSLVAAHLAASYLANETSSRGLVAGVGLQLSPSPTAMFQKAGMLAPDGRCKCLDSAADGYQDVIRAALAVGSLQASQVSSLQMHGTGTPLGDPIEVGAAAAVLINSSTSRAVPLAASIAKSWIGHTEPAAGVMGLLHACMGISHDSTQGIMHLTAVNPHISTVFEMSANKAAKVQGRILMPASGFVEMVAAGVRTLTNSSNVTGCVLASAVIPAPLALPQKHSSTAASRTKVQCVGAESRSLTPAKRLSNAASISTISTQRSFSMPPITPLTPRTPRTPRTPVFLHQPTLAESALVALTGILEESPSLLAQQLTNDELLQSLQVNVQDAVENAIGAPIALDEPLMAAGLDSLGATELQQALQEVLGVELPATLVFDYPTVEAIVAFAQDKLRGASALEVYAGSASPLVALTGGVTIIAGSAGQSALLQQYSSGDATTRVPYTRWDVDAPALANPDGSPLPQFGSFVEDADQFDCTAFGMVPSEAVTMDPQQRLLLQTSLEALPNGPASIAGHPIGAFVGIASSDYESLSHHHGVPLSAFSFTAAAPSVASGRIAYAFSLKGPTASVDTACSASLVAAHMAATSFRESPTEGAIVAGVLLCLVPQSTLMLQRASMMSPDGRSKTLDASADGYAAEVDGLQMHSNGTALGDPVEVGAAAAVYLQGSAHASPFTFATVKGYTGHQEAGAGVAGLMEATLLISHSCVPPALHLRHLNPHTRCWVAPPAQVLMGQALYNRHPRTRQHPLLATDVSLTSGLYIHAAHTVDAAAAEAAETVLETVAADNALLHMPEEERLMHLQATVMTEVRAMLGHAVHPDEPLMAVGLDSRGGMELRRTLAEAVGMQLPVTLLYDYQSVSAIVDYINGLCLAATGTADEQRAGAHADEWDGGFNANRGPSAAAADAKPSDLMKTLRGPATTRPLFLAAPGVANAQSAYFSFSSFLQWSDQPIYVLDKDNDLTIAQLAAVNAADILKVQPEGPYLLGGHSYGGAVAMEIALILESWGCEVGLVLIMDTPRPEQVRTLQPDATEATDEDNLELIEMILGALGRDALGLGSSIAHPRESDEWKAMTMEQKYAFFAPIWRVMRDDNMSVEQVKEHVQYVALSVKKGSQISDLRHHRFQGTLQGGQVVYFRGATPGACTYFDDCKDGLLPHAACWYDLCQDLQVIDVPGDHFSLLRQGDEDMQVIVTALKQLLAPFGWTEQVRREVKEYTMSREEVNEIDAYLQQMGVKDEVLRRRVEGALPWTDEQGLQAASAAIAHRPITQLNSPQHASLDSSLPSVFVVVDADRSLGPLHDVLALVPRPCFALQLPQDNVLAQTASIQQIATAMHATLRAQQPSGPHAAYGTISRHSTGHEVYKSVSRHASGVIGTQHLDLVTAWPGPDLPVPVVPINRLSAQDRHGAGAACPTGMPLVRLPLWIVHNERGDASANLRQLAQMLNLPCYGITMPPDAHRFASMSELAAAYTQTMTAVQPTGPHLIMGTSIVGCLLAYHMAMHLQAQGWPAKLILLDGCAVLPDLPLHEPTWYALFHLLRDMGTFRGSIGELVDIVRTGTSPARQLKLVSAFMPHGLGTAEALLRGHSCGRL